MRKTSLVVMSMLGLMMMTQSAFAFIFTTVYPGPGKGVSSHFFDNPVPAGATLRFNVVQGNFASTTYALPQAATGGAPGAASFGALDALIGGTGSNAPAAMLLPGTGFTEDVWGIFEVISIETDHDGDGNFAEPGELNAWTKAVNPGEEITAMVYGFVDNYVANVSLGPGLGFVGTTASTGFIGGTIGAGYVDFYWQAAGAGLPANFALAPGARTGLTSFPTITDGELFVTQRVAYDDSVPADVWGVDTGFVSTDVFNAAGVIITASTSPFLDIAGVDADGGPDGPGGVATEKALYNTDSFDTTTFPGGPFPGGFYGGGARTRLFDASADLVTTAVGAQPGWTLRIAAGRDLKRTIPEPSTVVLLGIGLLGLAAAARKRRAK